MKTEQIEIVSGFEANKLLWHSAVSILDKIASAEEDIEVFTTEVPEDAPPEIPRIVLKSSDSFLNVTLERFQFVFFPPRQATTSEDAIRLASEKYQRWQTDVLGKLDYVYDWCGVILSVLIPQEPSEPDNMNLATSVFDRLFGIDREGNPLCTLNLHFGFEQKDMFVHYNINQYEIRSGNIRITTGNRSINPHPSELPVEETGIRVRIDMNNKPKSRTRKGKPDLKLSSKENGSDVDNILDRISKLADNLDNDLNLKGVI